MGHILWVFNLFTDTLAKNRNYIGDGGVSLHGVTNHDEQL